MKNKIITAIGIEKIYRRIKEEIDCEILCKDILYEDGIFEVLENESKIDFIIINKEYLLINNYKNFINRIFIINRNIKIIILLNNKEENIKEFNNVKYIFINNYLFKNIKKEIVNNYVDDFYITSKEDHNKNFKEKGNSVKIISVAGSSGVGKSIFTASFAKCLNKKILIIDFDFFNNSIHTLFGVKKGEKEVKKINKNIDLVSTEEIYCKNKYKIKIDNIIELINRVKEKYDYILIDTSSEVFFEYTKEIFYKSDCIIFLIDPNLLELKKSINLLKIYKEKWGIENSKFKIVINKVNKNSIDKKLNKNIFFENEIIGEIKYSQKYNTLINRNMKDINKKIFFKKKYKKIMNQIELKEQKIMQNKGEIKSGIRKYKSKFFRNNRKKQKFNRETK